MSVGFNAIFSKFDSLYFKIKNTALDRRTIKIFNLSIPYNRETDLLAIPGISEADIRHSLVRGELSVKIKAADIIITGSSIDLLQFDANQRDFIENAGAVTGVNPDIDVFSGTTTLEAFGAVGDGITNDTAAFELASAALAAGTYKTLLLAAKTYMVNPTTIWPMGGSIIGQGPGSILKTTQARAIILMYDSNAVNRKKSTLFANFRMEGSASGSLGVGAPANQNGLEISYFGSDGASRVFMANLQGYRLDRAFSISATDELSIGPMGVNLHAEECKYGFFQGISSLVACQAVRCNTGITGNANTQFDGSLESCNIGINIVAGGNDGHGVFAGRIVHCTTPILSSGALTNGFLFNNIELFEGTISIANGNNGAIIFQGGQIDATIYNLNGKSRWLGVTFDTAYFSSLSTIGGDNEFIDCRKRDGTIPSWIQALIYQRYTFPGDANQILTAQQSRAPTIEILNGVIGTARAISLTRAPQLGEQVDIVNKNSQSINAYWSTGDGIVIPTNKTARMGADGAKAVCIWIVDNNASSVTAL